MDAVLGVDVGTSSTKGCLVALDGTILARAVRHHTVDRPRPGHVEANGETWWDEFIGLARELGKGVRIVGVGVSGMGPCALLTDQSGRPLRPAMLYGVDTRAGDQIAQLTDQFGPDEVLHVSGMRITHQSPAPKIAWLSAEEPAVFEAARRLFMPASWLSWRLTGEYTLDHHSASQCPPLYDARRGTWMSEWAAEILGLIELPRLVWADDIVGEVSAEAASLTGIPAGTPVVSGTIDAWTEAISANAHNDGDLMLMYGTTMFMVGTQRRRTLDPGALWSTTGAFRGTTSVAAGMSAGGAVTDWLRGTVGEATFDNLSREAAASAPGARGLLMLPYFAGERTPFIDPHARGVLIGLSLSHTRGDIYRAAWEGVGFGVRHNLEEMAANDVEINRVVAVGGGASNRNWPQVVTNIIGKDQVLPTHTIGASLGAAMLAARAVTNIDPSTWNPPAGLVTVDVESAETYDALYTRFRELYESTAPIQHALATLQERSFAGSSRDGDTDSSET